MWPEDWCFPLIPSPSPARGEGGSRCHLARLEVWETGRVVLLADSLGGEYFEHIASIHKQVPLSLLRRERNAASTNRFPIPGERARVRGGVWDAGHSGQIARPTRSTDKREGGISLPLLFSTVIRGV